MELPRLNEKTDEVLHRNVKSLRGTECSVIAEIILHLYEIDIRGIYRDAGYPSLFHYCTQGLGYSESAACRRIKAARALKNTPEIYHLIKEGKLSLCAAGTVSGVLTPENKAEVLELAQGKPKIEVDRIAAQYGPVEVKVKKETIRVCRRQVGLASGSDLFSAQAPAPKVEERFSITFELTAEEMALFEEAKTFIGPCPVKEVVVRSVKEFIKRKAGNGKRKEKVTATVAVKSETAVQSRNIPKAVQREVRERDGNCCTFVSADGKRCSERRLLQFDHRVPFALGGENSAQNLRLVCPAHNLLYAEKVFGREQIRQLIEKRRA